MTTYAEEDETLITIDGQPVVETEAQRLRRTLVDVLAALESGEPAPGFRIRAWREVAGVPYLDGLEPTERRDEGTARAARRWTDEEVAAVDRAIRTVAAKCVAKFREQRAPAHVDDVLLHVGRSDPLLEFTADNVWRELGPEFPVTKGLTGRLIAAKGDGVIRNTGTTRIADRGGDHDHGQRLTVWQAVP